VDRRFGVCHDDTPAVCEIFAYSLNSPHSIFHTTEQKMRTVYYLLMAASEDEETQKKGMVSIVVNTQKNRAVSFAPNGFGKIPAMARSLPIRQSALHVCVDYASASSSAFAAIVMLIVTSRIRARFRKHVGELRECY
jgi:hypothetical protein